ncbi:MAG: cupin domain-containing protein [Microbacteriaceae bacterium]
MPVPASDTPTSPALSVSTNLAGLTELVPINPAKLATKRVLEAPGARIVLIGFDAGQELREHTAGAPILIQVLTGAVEIAVGGTAREYLPGGLIHIAARVPHALVAREPSHVLLTLLIAA